MPVAYFLTVNYKNMLSGLFGVRILQMYVCVCVCCDVKGWKLKDRNEKLRLFNANLQKFPFSYGIVVVVILSKEQKN